jgi:hypothetical protein
MGNDVVASPAQSFEIDSAERESKRYKSFKCHHELNTDDLLGGN